jgi:hypothetical protein
MAFHALRYLPRSVYTFLQRNVTGRHFLRLTDAAFDTYHYHVVNFRRLATTGRALEFGAGSNLLTPLLLSSAGALEVLAFDVQRIATVAQVNHVIGQLRLRVPGDWPELSDLDSDLWRYYRIRYCAPMDARRTNLAPGSVDFFCSTSTLEHIPALAIGEILEECRRVASVRALFSFIIDYHDHYGTADPGISRFNFYRYPARRWRWFNPPNHYQNRLRHSDYQRIFQAHGLRTIEERPITVSENEMQAEAPCDEFSSYSAEDLRTLNGLFLLA